MDDSDWPAEWRRGLIEFAVLAVIESGESYGYSISTRLREAGFGTVKGSALYPLLRRLEESGALTSRWREGSGGPGRKFYALTRIGGERLEAQRVQWLRFTAGVSTLARVEEGTWNSAASTTPLA